MKILISGDDLEKSRNYFVEQKNLLTNSVFLQGEGLTFDQLFQSCENTSLFDEKINIIIENLFSKNKSNSTELKTIVEFINNKKDINLLIWEQTELSKAQGSLLKDFELKTFSIPQKLFVFLDGLKPNNSKNLIRLFHELRETQEPELILFMLVRQFRLFLNEIGQYDTQIEEINKMAPWQKTKLSTQAKYFTKQQLINSYNKLFEMETNQKTGKISYSIDTSIDFFLSDL